MTSAGMIQLIVIGTFGKTKVENVEHCIKLHYVHHGCSEQRITVLYSLL
jgi:hypothetical protein